MKVQCAADVRQSPREVQRSALFSNWAAHLRRTEVGTVTIQGVYAWGGEIRMLQMGVEYGGFNNAVFLRGATVDMLTVVTDGNSRFIVHVEQPRVAVGQVVRSNPAGMVDTGETLVVAALRELAEEVGAHIRWGRAVSMHPVVLGTEAPLLVSPGDTDEEVTFYVVEGTLSSTELRKLGNHIGGLAHEGERLRLRLTPLSQFDAAVALQNLAAVRGRPDLKAVTSLLMYGLYTKRNH